MIKDRKNIIGKNIKVAREAKRLSQREFARELGVSYQQLSQWENGEIKEMFLNPLMKLLGYNMLPVIYGDVIFDLKKGCVTLSTEKILAYLGKNLKKNYKVSRIIMCTNVDGIFTDDPNINPKAELIPLITPENIEEFKGYLHGSAGTDVTGGMLHKVKRMLELTEDDINTEIINAKKSGLLKKALLGEISLGTSIKKT